MNKAYDLQQAPNVSTTAHNFNGEPKIEIEKLEGRQRRIFAKIQIPYPLEQVWQVLTDYEAWSEFMPGTTQSRLLDAPNGGIHLEQCRTKSFLGLKKSGRSVFKVEEKFPNEIHYQLVEGDLKSFSGYWRLETFNTSNQKVGVELTYDISVVPKPIFPTALVELVLSQDVPASLLAIRQRVDQLFG